MDDALVTERRGRIKSPVICIIIGTRTQRTEKYYKGRHTHKRGLCSKSNTCTQWSFIHARMHRIVFYIPWVTVVVILITVNHFSDFSTDSLHGFCLPAISSINMSLDILACTYYVGPNFLIAWHYINSTGFAFLTQLQYYINGKGLIKLLFSTTCLVLSDSRIVQSFYFLSCFSCVFVNGFGNSSEFSLMNMNFIFYALRNLRVFSNNNNKVQLKVDKTLLSEIYYGLFAIFFT